MSRDRGITVALRVDARVMRSVGQITIPLVPLYTHALS